MENKIYLGTVKNSYRKDDNLLVNGEKVFLTKHSWDCGRYWGFGYIENSRLHTHFESVFLGEETDINKIFIDSVYTQKEWWILRDLFIQAYALSECSTIYRHGGHQTTEKGITDIIQSKKMENKINKDLEKILNKIWEFLTRDRGEIFKTFKNIEEIKEKIRQQELLKENETSKLEKLQEQLYKETQKIK